MSKIINVGRVTSYADAVAGGYQGTREEWEIVLANLGTTAAEVEANRQEVADNTQAVADDKTAVAADKASAAQSASEAAQSAESAHTDALAATAAKEAAQTAQGIAEEARADAVSAKGAAESAQTEANTSASAAAESALAAQNAAETATANAGAASDSATAAAQSAASVSGVVAEVTAAKTEALTAIETKGAETLDSIPDDYTELSGNVDDLQSAIDISNARPMTGWEKGSYNTTNGAYYTANNYIRHDQFIGYRSGTYKFKLAPGYRALMFAWDDNAYVGAYKTDGTWSKTASGWKTVTEFNLTQAPNYWIKIAITRDPTSADITPSEGESALTYKTTASEFVYANQPADSMALNKAGIYITREMTFTQGRVSPWDLTTKESDTYICTAYFDRSGTYKRYWECDDGYEFAVLADEKSPSAHLGAFMPSSHRFERLDNADNVQFVQRFEPWEVKSPNTKWYRVMMRNRADPTAAITPAEGSHLHFYDYALPALQRLLHQSVTDWNEFIIQTASFEQINGTSNGVNIPNAPYLSTAVVRFEGKVCGTASGGVQIVTDTYSALGAAGKIYRRNYKRVNNVVTWDVWQSITGFKPESYVYQSTTTTDRYALPILYLDGDTTGMSKDTKVTLNYRYKDSSGTCTCKWQGSSSLAYPKKNYTITLDNPITVVTRWGAQKKYVLKSEYFDATHARNTISARLWGEIVNNRETAKGASGNAKLLAAPNYGAMDGIHVMLVINGSYRGLYTLGIPKDAWMFAMTDQDANCAVLNAEVYGNMSVRFRQTTTAEAIENEQSFALEYASDDLTISDVANSINTAISAVIGASGSGYRSSIENYIDVDSAIDYLIFSLLTCNWDGIFHNYNLCTYDGTKWYFSAYDLDNTFGVQDLLSYDNDKTYDAPNLITPTIPFAATENRVLYLPYAFDTAAFKARYAELRAGIMSEYNVDTKFYNHMTNVSREVLAEEFRKWPLSIRSGSQTIDAIVNYYRLRCQYLDNAVNAL